MIKLLKKPKIFLLNIKLINRKGVTLIELIVVLAILGIVLSVAYPMFTFNQKTYTTINTRVNAQNEFRFIMNYFEKEIGTATRIKLLNDVDTTLAVDPGYRLIYIENIDGKGNLFKREESNNSSAISSSGLPGLTIEFSRIGSRVIRVKLNADGDHVLIKDIFTQNAYFSDIEADYGPVIYNYIKINPVN